MTEYSDRNALMRAGTLCLALLGLGLATTVAHAQSAGSSPLENSSTTIATATGADAGEITSPSIDPPRSERANVSSDSQRDAVSSNASTVMAGIARVAPKTIDEWKAEPKWPSAAITVGNVEYPKVDGVMLFGKLGLDKPLHVAQELSAAKLNVSNGVASTCILETIVNADDWLNKHPVGTFPTWDEYQIGSRYWWDLYKYNNGLSTCASK